MSEVVSIANELKRSGYTAYTNVGVSMLPLIREARDVILIERRDPDEIRKFDAVLFRRPEVRGRGEYVLHRVIRRYSDGRFWIVGDNCTSGEIVYPENVLGVMTAINRGGRTVKIDDFLYRAYVMLWCAPWPLRFAVLRAGRFAHRAERAIVRRVRRR